MKSERRYAGTKSNFWKTSTKLIIFLKLCYKIAQVLMYDFQQVVQKLKKHPNFCFDL